MRQRRLGPRLVENVERLVVHGADVLGGDPDRFSLLGARSACHPDFEPPLAQVVEHAHLFQEPPGLPQRQHPAEHADAQHGGPGRHRGGQHGRRRADAHAVEVMLAEENAVETQGLRVGPGVQPPVEFMLERGGVKPAGVGGSRDIDLLEYP